MMRFFFDARYIRTDYHDGISRYTTELGNALAGLTPVTFIISHQRQLDFLPSGCEYIKIHGITSAKEPFTARVLNKYHPDVVFSPMQTLGSISRRFKLILTLHDMIYYRHRQPPMSLHPVLRLGWRAYHLSYLPQRLTLNGADMVATVSETSKADILNAKLTKRPVIVIPNAPKALPKGIIASDTSMQPHNLVYMGSFMKYKNVETLIEGMKSLPGYTLHLLSRIAPERRKQLDAHIPHGAKVVFHNGVSDREYMELLADRAVLVCASRSEGYNLPLAEALSSSVPAVVSNLTIHHEVAGAGALYFDPDNPEAFADKVKQFEERSVREKHVKAGKQHINKYSWQKSAKILLEAARELSSQ